METKLRFISFIIKRKQCIPPLDCRLPSVGWVLVLLCHISHPCFEGWAAHEPAWRPSWRPVTASFLQLWHFTRQSSFSRGKSVQILSLPLMVEDPAARDRQWEPDSGLIARFTHKHYSLWLQCINTQKWEPVCVCRYVGVCTCVVCAVCHVTELQNKMS